MKNRTYQGVRDWLVIGFTLTLALSHQGSVEIGADLFYRWRRGIIQGSCIAGVVWDSGIDVGFVAFSAFVALGTVDDRVVGTELGVGAGKCEMEWQAEV